MINQTNTNPDLPDVPTLHEALAGPEQDKWHTAILEELAAIKEAGAWELINNSPLICNIISCHFVLQKKHRLEGKVMRHKACLLAQGSRQQEGIDYLET